MKHLLSLAIALALSTSASAQTLEPDSGPWPLEPQATIIPELVGSTASAASPSAKNYIRLKYYDKTSEKASIHVPAMAGEKKVISLSQRFTLPTESGILDSIQITFDSVDGQLLYLAVMRDSVSNSIGDGLPYHYKVGSAYGYLYAVELKIGPLAVQKDFTIKFPVGHVKVPKEFHIMISTIQFTGKQGVSEFTLPGAAHIGRTAMDTSRSGTLWTTDDKNYWIDMFDGMFKVDDQPLGMDFYIDAIVDISTADVVPENVQAASVSPNPVSANASLRVMHQDMISSISIVNMLGVRVASWDGLSRDVELPTLGLPKGMYSLLVTTETGVTTQKVIIH